VEDIKTLTMILNDSAKNGYAILQNLLDWSRSQTGMLEINAERIDLKNLVDRNFSNLQLSANNKEIKIYLESLDDIYIFTDKNMISTVLRNLLSNAIKFTRRGGKVMVGAQVDSDEVIISVKDNGIGIPENKIEMLFRIDKRNSTPGTENEQGTGLGLKLSKEFIEKLGGRLWVESIENKGSTFKFSVPIKEG
jgi:two-component system sensor histidine kinase/response regulator